LTALKSRQIFIRPSRFAPVQNAGGHPKNGDQKMKMFGVKNEIHILSFGFILCSEVILSQDIFKCCSYFIFAKHLHFPPFLSGP
jgi:hypothetical protein